ncbi:MAG: hypothetical protein IJM39_07165 [Firmicutes bacterium]|nr:hypothetical protein [Bacillota bacterium]
MKNVFLTTLDRTRYRNDMEYFACGDFEGARSFITGISFAEGGIKYILARHRIDEVIVIGPKDFAGEEELKKTAITNVKIDNMASLDSMSEYGFLCYRLAEYIHQIDFEMVDAGEAVSEEVREKVESEIKAFLAQHAPGIPARELFAHLCEDPALAAKYEEAFGKGRSREERKWLKHSLYTRMDSFYKTHALPENRSTAIRFMPVDMDGVISIDSMTDIVRSTLGQGEDVQIFMDIQGLNAADGNILLSTFMLLNKRTGYNVSLSDLIKTEKQQGRFCGRVLNVRRSYDIHKLLSGIETFLEYGKDRQLKQYWESLGAEDPDAKRLFAGMDLIDEGVSLCNVDLMACGFEVIRRVIADPKVPAEKQSIYLSIMTGAIRADYGRLLEGDELSIPELLKWSHRKGLYQQTLTIIESRVPADMVKRGIYYYAKSEEDISRMLEALNLLYWNEPARTRYAFSDVEHYFIKYYGRFAIDYRQKPDAVVNDYTQLRIDALRGGAGGLTQAYSDLGDDGLLYALLQSYYRIGNLRNQVNHAQVDRAAAEGGGELKRKDSREDLDTELDKFIGLYSKACDKVQKSCEPLILEGGRLRGYVRKHELRPLEEETDLTQSSTVECEFDGKNVLINIRMLKPEADGE